MKRSEMIQHIYEDLLTKLDHYKFSHGSDVWAEFVANEMLDMIEGFGMLPPPENEEMHKSCSTRFNYGWEPEDE